MSYVRRVIDDEIDALFPDLPALSLEGAKAVGKTATALRRAQSVHRLDDVAELALADADPSRILEGDRPILIDEWQRLPAAWDLVRRAVDAAPGRGASFLLTGSAAPVPAAQIHSGAGRIVSVRMRPLTLSERGLETPTVRLRDVLSGTGGEVEGDTAIGLADYVREILASGFPGLRGLPQRALRAQLDGYVDRVVERDFPQLGLTLRNPAALRRWLSAYAAATSTTASYETIRDAATGGEGEKPSKMTVGPYRDVLERLWVVDPVPAWAPTRNRLRRLSSPPKHQLVDPALAARLLGIGEGALLHREPAPTIPSVPRNGSLLGAFFESLVTNDVRVYAQAAEARVAHLRTAGGEHEIDLIVERDDGRIVAIEIKLSATVDDRDVRHLRWLKERLGNDVLELVVITTGRYAYRRPDGVLVIPASLLGP